MYEHGPTCPCLDCAEDRERTTRCPALWEQLRDAAEGRTHDVADVVEWALETHGAPEVIDAARDAYRWLTDDDQTDAAAALAEEVNAQC